MSTSHLLFPNEHMTVGNYAIDVRRSDITDTRQALLLIHGIGVSGTYLIPFATILARHFNVHVLDLPGYGATPKPKRALGPKELASICAAYTKKAGITHAIVVGQSMGCQTAVHLAVNYPETCSKLLLIGPTVNKWERSIFWQSARLVQDGVREPFAANVIILTDYLRMGIVRYLQTLQAMLNDHIEEHITDVCQPVCIIRGANDPIAPKKWVEYLASKLDDPTVLEVTGGPHNVQFTKPEELFAACEEFLKK